MNKIFKLIIGTPYILCMWPLFLFFIAVLNISSLVSNMSRYFATGDHKAVTTEEKEFQEDIKEMSKFALILPYKYVTHIINGGE